MNRIIVIPALAALLTGCVVGADSARHDMEASKAANQACLAALAPEACEGQRRTYATDLSAYRATPKLVIGAGSAPPLPASDGVGTLAPPQLPPLPDMRSRLLVPGGGGTLMELGGDNPQLMVPAGGGAFMALP